MVCIVVGICISRSRWWYPHSGVHVHSFDAQSLESGLYLETDMFTLLDSADW